MDRARPVLHAALRARSWRARQLWYLLLVASTAAFVYAALHFLRDDWFYRGRLQHARCVVKPARSWLMTIEELFPEAVGPQGWSRLLTKYKLHFYVNDSNDLKVRRRLRRASPPAARSARPICARPRRRGHADTTDRRRRL